MDPILYFAYGALIDRDAMATIIGRADGLIGQEAYLEDYALVIQNLDQVPDVKVTGTDIPLKQILKKNWGEEFKSYAVVHKTGARVSGIVWRISRGEYRKICNWEMVDVEWFQDSDGTAKSPSGEQYSVKLNDLGKGQEYQTEVDGLNYQPFIGTKEKFLEIAKRSQT